MFDPKWAQMWPDFPSNEVFACYIDLELPTNYF